jgi:hypothetical protein
MTRFLVHHRHAPTECAVAFAAWRGFVSPLRHGAALGSCARGGHELWWVLDAEGVDGALAQLPTFLATRATAVAVDEIPVP